MNIITGATMVAKKETTTTTRTTSKKIEKKVDAKTCREEDPDDDGFVNTGALDDADDDDDGEKITKIVEMKETAMTVVRDANGNAVRLETSKEEEEEEKNTKTTRMSTLAVPQPEAPTSLNAPSAAPKSKLNNKPKKKKRELRERMEDHRGKPVTYEIDTHEFFVKLFDRKEVLRELLVRKGVAHAPSSKNNKGRSQHSKEAAEGERQNELAPQEIEKLNLIKMKTLLENEETIEKADMQNVKELVEDFASFFIATFDEKRKKWAKICFRENAKRRKAKAEENAKKNGGKLADGLENVFEKPSSREDFIKILSNPKKKSNRNTILEVVNKMPRCRVTESSFGVTKTKREMIVPAVLIRAVSNVPEYRAYTYSVNENVRGLEEEKRRKLLVSDQDGEYRVANENDSDFSDEEEDFETGEDQYPWHRRDDLLLHLCLRYIIGESSKLDDFLIQDVLESTTAAGSQPEEEEEEGDAKPSKTEDTTKMKNEDAAVNGGQQAETQNENNKDRFAKLNEQLVNDKDNLSDNAKTNTVTTQTKRQYTAMDTKAKQVFETALSALAPYISGVPPVNYIASRIKLFRIQGNNICDIAKNIESMHNMTMKSDKPIKKKKCAASNSLPKLKTIDAIAKEVISRESIDFFPRRLHEFESMEGALDSFRTLFCPRCHTYSCQIHGNGHMPSTGRRIITNYRPEWNDHWNRGSRQKKRKDLSASESGLEYHRSKETTDATADADTPVAMDVDDSVNNKKKEGGQKHNDSNINNNDNNNVDDRKKETAVKDDALANYLALAKPKEPCRSSRCWRANIELLALVKKLQPPWLPPSERMFCAPIPADNSDPMEVASFVSRDDSITDEYLSSIIRKYKHTTNWKNWVVEMFNKSVDIFEDSANPCVVAGFLKPCDEKPPACKIVCEEMLSMFCEDILDERREDRAAEAGKSDGNGGQMMADVATTTTDTRKGKGPRLIKRAWETQAESKRNSRRRKWKTDNSRQRHLKKRTNVGYQGKTAKSTIARRKEASAGDKNTLWCEYEPCNCPDGICTDECPCSLNWNFCDINCGCGADCNNTFVGCSCKGDCSKSTCPCKIAARECDPDKCANCWPSIRDYSRRKRELEGITLDMEIFSSDPNLVGITEFNSRKRKDNNVACKNMNLQLNKHAHVLLGKSPIAGWGAFFGVDVKKDDFLGEYVGEMITHSEAERRGSQYDQTNSSFLFNLNDNWVLDAYSRGNKFKFANHSKNPNCYPLVIYARGNHRIGIYAKADSKFGDEIFYDYGYTKDIIGEARVWAHDDDQEDVGTYRK